MQKLKLVFDFSSRTMYSPSNSKAVFLVSKRGKLYIECPQSVFYTEKELRKMHRHFYHPSSEKLYAQIKRADGDSVDTDIERTLKLA